MEIEMLVDSRERLKKGRQTYKQSRERKTESRDRDREREREREKKE